MAGVFQPGQLVRVRGTGGPEMLVEGYDETGRVLCSFWEGVSRKSAPFCEGDLERLALPSPPPPAALP
jgi:uncharacterized protein YodC (DUF2158 family)